MNNRRAKILRARAGGYVHPQKRTYKPINVRHRYSPDGAVRKTATFVCDAPAVRRYKTLKRAHKGLLS